VHLATGAFFVCGVFAMIDRNAIKRYHKRVDRRLAERGIRFDGNRWEESEHPRAKDGKFTDGSDNAGAPEVKEKKSIPTEKTSSAMTKADIKVNGPKESNAYIESYFKQHPEVQKEAEKYKGVLDNVMQFTKKFPDAKDEHSYDAITGEEVNVDKGHCVTFHQNFKIGDEYGGYDSETYAAMCAIAMHKLGAEKCYIGYFGNPEISFNCPDKETARQFAIEHNQHSVFDAETFELWENPNWDEGTNPIKGKGSN